MKIHQADTVLKKAFAVGPALIAVALFIAVRCLGSSGNTRFVVRSLKPDCKAPSYTRIMAVTRPTNTISEGRIVGLGRGKSGFAEDRATSQCRTHLA
jgi:hypothetical protein